VNNKIHLVRLLIAIAVSLGVSFFVIQYSRLAFLRFRYEHPYAQLINGTEFLKDRAWIGYSIPLTTLLAGLFALRRGGSSSLMIEVVIGLSWVFAFAWFGLCLLAWQAQNVPVFSHMEWHF